MNKYCMRRNIATLVASILTLHFLAPSFDPGTRNLVSLAFALVLIFSSRASSKPKYLIRYGIYIAISMFTYTILFSTQPWSYLFDHGIYEPSIIPLIVCSVLMSFAGGLLLKRKKDRIKYVFVTLGVQVPIGLLLAMGVVESVLTEFSYLLRFDQSYSGVLQAWQFEWMLTYYLPIYYFARKEQMINQE